MNEKDKKEIIHKAYAQEVPCPRNKALISTLITSRSCIESNLVGILYFLLDTHMHTKRNKRKHEEEMQDERIEIFLIN